MKNTNKLARKVPIKSQEDAWFERNERNENADGGAIYFAIGTWVIIFLITFLYVYFGKG